MATRIRLLGGFSAEHDGKPLPVTRRAKGAALLAYLLVTGQPQTREHLADLLWDVPATATGLSNLRVLLTRIRKGLPGLIAEGGTIRYEVQEGDRVDFLALQAALAADGTDLDGLRLYTGELLTGLLLDQAPRFQEWLLIRRERLRRAVLDAHRRLCERLADREDWAAGAEAAEHWLTIDTLDESACRWLMQFQAAGGRGSEALVRYERFRSRLKHQLDLEPERETEALAQRIRKAYGEALAGLFSQVDYTIRLGWPETGELLPPGPLPSNAVFPFRRNPDFQGRQPELLRLARALLPWPDLPAPASPPLALVTGLAGIGKTQLAVEFAYRCGRFFPGGVFWLNFGDPDSLPDQFADLGGPRALDLDAGRAGEAVLRERVDRVRRALQEPEPRLLIFDNCEDGSLLRAWLPNTGGCRVLVTSRRAGWGRDLGGTRIALPGLSSGESAELLRRLAPSLSETEAAGIAAEVGYLPLALHLSGGFLRRYGVQPGTYLRQLREKNPAAHPALSGQGADPSPTGHELDVSRTFAVSLDVLQADDPVGTAARRMLARVLCFAPGEPVPTGLLAGRSAGADPAAFMLDVDALERLVTLGFVTRGTGSEISIHRLLASFGLTWMPAGEIRTARERVERCLIEDLQAQWDTEIHLGRLPLAPAHLRHIVEAALARRDERSAQLANFLARHLIDLGEAAEARGLVQQALEIREIGLGLLDLETAVYLTNLGQAHSMLGDLGEAVPCYERAHAICRASLGDDHVKTAQSALNLAVARTRTGRYAEAEGMFHAGLAAYDRLLEPDDLRIALAQANLGVLYRQTDRFEQAAACHSRALQIRETGLAPDHPLVASSLQTLGYLSWRLGRFAEGLAYHGRSLEILKKLHGREHLAVASSLVNIGVCELGLGALDDAEAHLGESLAIRRGLLEPGHVLLAQSDLYLGHLALLRGRLEEAEGLLSGALEVLEAASGYEKNRLDALRLLGELKLRKGDREAARALLERARGEVEARGAAEHPDLEGVIGLSEEVDRRMGSSAPGGAPR